MGPSHLEKLDHANFIRTASSLARSTAERPASADCGIAAGLRTVSVPVSFGHHSAAAPTRTFPNAASSAVPIVPLHGRLMTPTRIPTTIPADGGTSPNSR